jgi:hypothetical protein
MYNPYFPEFQVKCLLQKFITIKFQNLFYKY